jgi:hypothetical protein
MDTDYLPALGTDPPLLLRFDEMFYAGLAYLPEIANHAHAVLGSISLIQMVQVGAGEAVATVAVPGLGHLLTVLDTARYARFRFESVVAPAAGTGLAVPHIGPAETAIHSARSDQARAKWISSCRSFWRHVCIPELRNL